MGVTSKPNRKALKSMSKLIREPYGPTWGENLTLIGAQLEPFWGWPLIAWGLPMVCL